MKKKFLAITIAFVTLFSLNYFAGTSVSAAYGKIGNVVTPVSMRGKWYYKGSKLLGQNPHKIYKVKIGKHHVNGIKLYQANLKVTQKYAANYHKYRFVIAQTMNWANATIFNSSHNLQWLNVNGWTAGAGNGTYYALVPHQHHGKEVTALAIAIGYKPTIVAYAYRHHKPIHHYPQIKKTDLGLNY